MKLTKLTTLASAAVVCFGGIVATAGQGDLHLVSNENFEQYSIAKVNPDEGSGAFEYGVDSGSNYPSNGLLWDFSMDDASEITSVTDFGDLGAQADGNKVLKLDTQGNELKYYFNRGENGRQGTTTNFTVLVDSAIQMIGSETAPVVSNAQTAVYLDISDESNHVLRAWVSTNGYEAWVALTNADVHVSDGDWIQLQIKVDYTESIPSPPKAPDVSFFVNGHQMVSAVDNATALFKSANNSVSRVKKCVTEVAFKGNGLVDNFTVTEVENYLSFLTVIQEFVDASGAFIGRTFETNVLTLGSRGTYLFDMVGSPDDITGYDVVNRVQLFKSENGVDSLVGNGYDSFKTCVTNVDPVLHNVTVTFEPTEDDDYVSGDTYIVRGYYDVNMYDLTLEFYDSSKSASVSTSTMSLPYNYQFSTNVALIWDAVRAEADGATLEDLGVEYYDKDENEIHGAVSKDNGIIAVRITQESKLLLTGYWTFDEDPPPEQKPGIVFGSTEGGSDTNLIFTAVSLGTTPSVTFQSYGTTNGNGTMTLWIIARESLTGPTATNIFFKMNAAATAPATGTITGTLVLETPTAFDGYNSLFFRGITAEDPSPAQNE